MAKMGDTGIGKSGNFIKPADLVASERAFVITNAKFRPEHDEFNAQVNVTIRYYEPDDNGEMVAICSLPHNDVRQLLIDWFRNGGDEINGEDEENGLILTGEGRSGSPYIFADAPGAPKKPTRNKSTKDITF